MDTAYMSAFCYGRRVDTSFQVSERDKQITVQVTHRLPLHPFLELLWALAFKS